MITQKTSNILLILLTITYTLLSFNYLYYGTNEDIINAVFMFFCIGGCILTYAIDNKLISYKSTFKPKIKKEKKPMTLEEIYKWLSISTIVIILCLYVITLMLVNLTTYQYQGITNTQNVTKINITEVNIIWLDKTETCFSVEALKMLAQEG